MIFVFCVFSARKPKVNVEVEKSRNTTLIIFSSIVNKTYDGYILQNVHNTYSNLTFPPMQCIVEILKCNVRIAHVVQNCCTENTKVSFYMALTSK